MVHWSPHGCVRAVAQEGPYVWYFAKELEKGGACPLFVAPSYSYKNTCKICARPMEYLDRMKKTCRRCETSPRCSRCEVILRGHNTQHGDYLCWYCRVHPQVMRYSCTVCTRTIAKQNTDRWITYGNYCDICAVTNSQIGKVYTRRGVDNSLASQ